MSQAEALDSGSYDSDRDIDMQFLPGRNYRVLSQVSFDMAGGKVLALHGGDTISVVSVDYASGVAKINCSFTPMHEYEVSFDALIKNREKFILKI